MAEEAEDDTDEAEDSEDDAVEEVVEAEEEPVEEAATVEEAVEEEAPAEEASSDDVDYSSMTVAELKEFSSCRCLSLERRLNLSNACKNNQRTFDNP